MVSAMVEIRGAQYEGWLMSVGVRKPINEPHPGKFFIDRQEIRASETSSSAAVPFVVHNGPFDTPEAAFEKGFNDCREMIDRLIEPKKRATEE